MTSVKHKIVIKEIFGYCAIVLAGILMVISLVLLDLWHSQYATRALYLAISAVVFAFVGICVLFINNKEK